MAPYLIPALTGIFALLAAYLAWRLKQAGDDRAHRLAIELDRKKVLRDLYAEIFQHLEQAMKHGQELKPFELTAELSRANANLRLLASDDINLAYDDVSDKLRVWSALYARASPRQMQMGDQTITIFQSPDPTAEFKAPAETAQQSLHDSVASLRTLMRKQLSEA